MNQVSRLATVSDADAARMVTPATLADLAGQIMASPVPPADIRRPARARPPVRARASWRLPARAEWPARARARPPGRARTRRRLLTGIPVAAALAVAALMAAALASPGQRVGPVPVGPPRAQAAALTFTQHGGYLDVIVRDPVAAAATYRAEFAAHHLHITLQLVPASPSLVGTLVYGGTSSGATGITTITAQGRCWTGGGGNACPVGVRVPVGFRGSADFAFGRAARPGEQYETTGPVTAPGEAMHGLRYQGRTVAAVLAMLAPRHVTVARYRYQNASGSTCGTVPRPVPAGWRVYAADPWAPHQVMLWAGPPAGVAAGHCAHPTSTGTPLPTPTASPSAKAAPGTGGNS